MSGRGIFAVGSVGVEVDPEDVDVEEEGEEEVDDDDVPPPHVPNPGWHPVPQYSVVLPQKPYCEQQGRELGQI
jgi:hypothetical protein